MQNEKVPGGDADGGAKRGPLVFTKACEQPDTHTHTLKNSNAHAFETKTKPNEVGGFRWFYMPPSGWLQS